MLIDHLSHKPKKRVFLSIWLNFVEGDQHGCSKKCQFCNFKAHPFYMCPEIKDLKEFLTDYASQFEHTKSVLLSGGGDPLYHFEKNKDKLFAILQTIQLLNYEAVIQSFELDIIRKYYNTPLFKNVIAYYFSCENFNADLRQLAVELVQAGKKVVISKVLNNSKKVDDLNFKILDDWVNYYDLPGVEKLIHENYNFCFSKSENDELYKNIAERYAGKSVRYKAHYRTIDQFVGLMNNEVWLGQDFIFLKFLNQKV